MGERPQEAEDRAVPGHWEGDLLSGSRNTHIATLVERSSRFVMLVRVGGKDTESVAAALSEQIRRLPGTMMATLTWDRGPEMAAHKKFTVATDVSVYFCDPKRAPGSEERARTQTGSSGSTCPGGLTYLCTIKPTSTLSLAQAQHEAAQDPRIQHPGCYTG
jgi:hypothetical protein